MICVSVLFFFLSKHYLQIHQMDTVTCQHLFLCEYSTNHASKFVVIELNMFISSLILY